MQPGQGSSSVTSPQKSACGEPGHPPRSGKRFTVNATPEFADGVKEFPVPAEKIRKLLHKGNLFEFTFSVKKNLTNTQKSQTSIGPEGGGHAIHDESQNKGRPSALTLGVRPACRSSRCSRYLSREAASRPIDRNSVAPPDFFGPTFGGMREERKIGVRLLWFRRLPCFGRMSHGITSVIIVRCCQIPGGASRRVSPYGFNCLRCHNGCQTGLPIPKKRHFRLY